MKKFLVFVNIEQNDFYDILTGGPNYLGHTFVMEEEMTEDDLRVELIKILNELKINFISISIYETQDKSQKILNFEQVKSKFKRGLYF